jgi:hypothetical protein
VGCGSIGEEKAKGALIMSALPTLPSLPARTAQGPLPRHSDEPSPKHPEPESAPVSPAETKASLQALLEARRLQAAAPPLRGEVRATPLPTGIASLDGLLRGGFPRGQMSEVYGPASSGRTGLLVAAAAQATRTGALAAWVDPGDRFDPSSAAAAGADLERLLWLRGRRGVAAEVGALGESVAALATVLGSGLFAMVVLDVAGLGAHEWRRLPAATWIRLQRAVASTPAALVLLADAHVAASPLGVSLALAAREARFAGAPGPGRLLTGLTAFAEAGPYARRQATFALRAV